MSKELNCMNCSIGDFKHELCDCDNGFCKEFKGIGSQEDFFNAVMQRTRSQWISVSERLPEYRQTVLISTKWGVNVAFRDSIDEGVTDDFWDCPLNDSMIVAGTGFVTAWQPLPEPYKGGNTEWMMTD